MPKHSYLEYMLHYKLLLCFLHIRVKALYCSFLYICTVCYISISFQISKEGATIFFYYYETGAGLIGLRNAA